MLVFLVNAFPSPDIPNKGAFNLRAAKSLGSASEILVIHLRSFNPKRRIIEEHTIEGLNVVVFSGIYTDRISNRITALILGIYKYTAFLLLKKHLRNADVLHSAGASHAGVVAAHFAKKTGLSHIAQFIGSDINFVLPKIDSYLGVKGWHRHVDIMVSNSIGLSKTIKERYNVQPKVIYRGVDLNEFNTSIKEKPDPTETLSFLYLGGLSPRKGNPHGMNLKGGLDLIQAWKKVYRLIGDNQSIELYFGGPDVSQKKLHEILGFQPSKINIQTLGYLDKYKVKDYLKKVHVVIVPSMAEGLPNLAMEASASSCAVIGSKVGGTPEVINHMETGILFEAGNVSELSAAISFFIGSPDKSLLMGQKGRQKMEKEFNAKYFAPAYLKLYEA